ncbi:MAG: alpha/beta fold hydrolase [Acidimicrobiia bacterium]
MAVALATSACTAGSGATTSIVPEPGSDETTSTVAPTTVTSSTLADTTSTTAGPPTLPGATKAFQPAPCDAILDPLAPPVPNAVCGFVSVPLDHADPAVGAVRIAVSYFANFTEGPPMMAFLGGPGIGNAGLLGAFAGAPFPILMMDERGTGSSEPSLDCPEVEADFERRLTEPFFHQPALERYRVALQQCRDRLADAGIDLGMFGSDQSARDIGIVHRALGFQEVTLLGASYGSRLILTKLREEPDGVRGVILESPVPVEWNMFEARPMVESDALQHLFSACRDDQICHGAHGDLMSVIADTMTRLDAEPVTVTVSRAVGDEELPMLFDGDAFLIDIMSAMGDTFMIPRLPQLITRVSEGDIEALVTLGDSMMEMIDPIFPFSEGMQTSVICYEEDPFNDPSAIEAAVDDAIDLLDLRFYEEAVDDCAIWDIEAAGPIENQPVQSDVPALVIAGAFDPITPVSNAEMIAAALPNATVVVHPAGGHGAGPSSPCTLGLVDSFFEDPNATLDTSCVDGMTGPRFAGR